MEIFNKDISVIGDLTLNVDNSAGDILTIDGLGVVNFRTAAETLLDMGVQTENHVHDQGLPSLIWTINHGLSKYPSVTAVDSAGSVVVGNVNYINVNNLTITFNASFSGKAYIN